MDNTINRRALLKGAMQCSLVAILLPGMGGLDKILGKGESEDLLCGTRVYALSPSFSGAFLKSDLMQQDLLVVGGDEKIEQWIERVSKTAGLSLRISEIGANPRVILADAGHVYTVSFYPQSVELDRHILECELRRIARPISEIDSVKEVSVSNRSMSVTGRFSSVDIKPVCQVYRCEAERIKYRLSGKPVIGNTTNHFNEMNLRCSVVEDLPFFVVANHTQLVKSVFVSVSTVIPLDDYGRLDQWYSDYERGLFGDLRIAVRAAADVFSISSQSALENCAVARREPILSLFV